jgi:hypothetical protein
VNTVVLFEESRVPSKNRVISRSLRKVAFIDNRLLDAPSPNPGEHWLVEIVRENLSDDGGCFILRPLSRVPPDDLAPLLHGMYDLEVVHDSVVVNPKDPTKKWAMSIAAKRAILDSTGCHSFVINQGGGPWRRRKKLSDVLAQETQSLTEALGFDDKERA